MGSSVLMGSSVVRRIEQEHEQRWPFELDGLPKLTQELHRFVPWVRTLEHCGEAALIQKHSPNQHTTPGCRARWRHGGVR
jgi:hypothetical protein